jgi:choice-of-anchor A domain-containing protein
MNDMAAARHSRAEHSLLAQSPPYQAFQLLILSIVLVLGCYPSLPGLPIARASQSAGLSQPVSDQTHALIDQIPSTGSSASTTTASGQLGLAASPAQAIPDSLSTALGFNIFVVGDLAQHHSITYGRIAAGGNAVLERYRIGDTLPRARDNRADLIVGGTLIFTDGLVAKGGIVAGGQVILDNVGIPHGKVREGLPIDFGAQGAALAELAAGLSQLPANGITQIKERRNTRKQITLSGTDRQINIFAVAGSDLAVAQTLIISVPRGASVLLNIDGAADRIRDIGFAIGTTNRQHILYNFYQASELTLDDDRIQGSILAPHARIAFVRGRVNGTVIGATLTGTGIAWPAPFTGQLPATPSPP